MSSLQQTKSAFSRKFHEFVYSPGWCLACQVDDDNKKLNTCDFQRYEGLPFVYVGYSCSHLLNIAAKSGSRAFNFTKFPKYFMDFISINFQCAVHYPFTSPHHHQHGIHRNNLNNFMVVSYHDAK